ncbi:MAG: DAK2 domain-containing protein, partial [Reyranella sp.]|nr:DAK2 domain-containing protein [Reyranella sp.]
ACTVPGGRAGFALGEDDMELGLGIHGEAGVRRAPLQPADAIVDELLASILADLAPRPGERAVLLVNGLGGTPPMELAIVARHALARLRANGIEIARAWSGNLMTALEMPGVSLSLMTVDDTRLARLDAPTDAPAWPGGGRLGTTARVAMPVVAAVPNAGASAATPAGQAVRRSALRIADALITSEARLTELDAAAGDGDLGLSATRAAHAIRALPDSAWTTPASALAALAGALGRAMGGSSGPFYATALLRAARGLPDAPTPTDWATAFAAGVASVPELGGARPGDRTMLDALLPAVRAFEDGLAGGASPADAWKAAIEAAEHGAMATAAMAPRLGRAAYLGERVLGVPDAGATAVAIWLRAIGSGV